MNKIKLSQHSVSERVSFNGHGVHSNIAVEMTICPAEANFGIQFMRTDLPSHNTKLIPAVRDSVSATELCTILGEHATGSIATVEHLMSALCGLGVDNALIEITGPEVPVMDGSAYEFVEAINEVGLKAQAAPRRYIRIDKPVQVQAGASHACLEPHNGRLFDVEIDFTNPTIGRQRFVTELTAASFTKEISRARTFGFMSDVERLWAAGFAKGSSLDNSVVVGDDGVVNPDGIRYPDEFVRHKLLDAVGDLALAGYQIIGAYRSYRGGHNLNFEMLNALFADPSAWSLVEFEDKALTQGASNSGNSFQPIAAYSAQR